MLVSIVEVRYSVGTKEVKEFITGNIESTIIDVLNEWNLILVVIGSIKPESGIIIPCAIEEIILGPWVSNSVKICNDSAGCVLNGVSTKNGV